MPWPEAVTLKGDIATIVPLDHSHTADLQEATSDGELHKLWYTTAASAENMTKEKTKRNLRAKRREKSALLYTFL